MRLTDFEYVTERNNDPDGRILIVGMMKDGPIGRGFKLTDPKKVNRFLGDNEVTRAFQHLISTGVTEENILLYRLNGSNSRINFVKERDTPQETLFMQFMSLTGSSYDNNIEVTVSDEGIVIMSNYQPRINEDAELEDTNADNQDNPIETGARQEFRRTYLFQDYPLLTQLADAVTNDATLGLHNIIANAPIYGLCLDYFLPEKGIPFLEGSSEEGMCVRNGIYPEDYVQKYADLFERYVSGENFLGSTFTQLSKHNAELMYFPDLPVDGVSIEKNEEFKNSVEPDEIAEYQRMKDLEASSKEEAKSMALIAGKIAKQKTEEAGLLCTALFRTKIVPKIQQLQEGEYMNEDGTYRSLEQGIDLPFLPTRNRDRFISNLNTLFTEEDKKDDSSLYIQVVVGENQLAKTDYAQQDAQVPIMNRHNFIPGATYYASEFLRRSVLKPLMNKQIADFSRLNSELTKPLVASLSANGYICIVPSIRRGFVSTKVQSIGNEQGFVGNNFYHFRIMGYIKRDITRILNEYIGKPESIYWQNDVGKDLSEYLSLYQSQRIIKNFSVEQLKSNPYHGETSIEISIQMHHEVSSVKATIAMSEEGWGFDLWDLSN